MATPQGFMREPSKNLSFTLLLLSGGSSVWFMTARSRKLITLHVTPVSSWHSNSVLLAWRIHAGDFSVGQFIVRRIRFFGDLLHAVVSYVHCLYACWLVFKATNRRNMIWLRAQVACLTICFAFFFPMSVLCSSTSAAILLCAL